jgi:hypothetical protein
VIAIVSHDAGGAEILSSYARRHGGEYVYVLDGPARQVFARKHRSIEAMPLDDALDRAGSVICGTSWQSDLELRAIARARQAGKRSAAFLDHWINYRERFERSGSTTLPDEIWVGDEFARRLALERFPGIRVTLVENPYFLDLREELARIDAASRRDRSRLSVLYVADPVRDTCRSLFGDERHLGYTEEEALRYFLANLHALAQPIERVAIRPHPAEPIGKYDWAAHEFPGVPIVSAGARPLLQDVVAADVVVGCDTTAMVVGLLAGKRVVSAIPPGGRAASLPHEAIERLSALCASSQAPL